MSSVRHSNVISMLSHSYVIRMSLVCHPCVTGMYSYAIRMWLVCTRISSVCHSSVLVCHPYVTRMYSMSSVCTRMSSVCDLYVLVCHPYVTHMYSYVIRMSLVCTRMSSMSLVCGFTTNQITWKLELISNILWLVVAIWFAGLNFGGKIQELDC